MHNASKKQKTHENMNDKETLIVGTYNKHISFFGSLFFY